MFGRPAEVRGASGAEAAAWFARSRSGAFSKADRQALQAWLDQSAAHRQAYIEVIDLWNAAEGLRASPEVLDMREAALRRYPASARRAPWRVTAAVAAGALALGAATWLMLASSRPVAQVFQTGVGQTATIALIDGSKLTLDTDTTVRTSIGAHQRNIRLERGRAYFKVAHDASRPFVVEADGKSVLATGTAFEVTSEPRRFEVLLVEGHVKVSQKTGKDAQPVSTELAPGLASSAGRVGGGSWPRRAGPAIWPG